MFFSIFFRVVINIYDIIIYFAINMIKKTQPLKFID